MLKEERVKRRAGQSQLQTRPWIELLRLYEDIKDMDHVNSIFAKVFGASEIVKGTILKMKDFATTDIFHLAAVIHEERGLYNAAISEYSSVLEHDSALFDHSEVFKM
jgi:hypothetical protein